MRQRSVHPWKLGVWPWQRLRGQLRRTGLWWAALWAKSPDRYLLWTKKTCQHATIVVLFQSSRRVVRALSGVSRVTVSLLVCSVMAELIVLTCQMRPNVVSKHKTNGHHQPCSSLGNTLELSVLFRPTISQRHNPPPPPKKKRKKILSWLLVWLLCEPQDLRISWFKCNITEGVSLTIPVFSSSLWLYWALEGNFDKTFEND